ncbi:RpiR family transcriptional regulator [Virgisporangium aliadipatigenens]|uniref:RpiR family transcriptional regulator n=1 Tax=Virgisporangium aliadipatigenens TaxID=741659 RepID=A0A8J3YRF5_9ACTN|nr:RpiR family transcriptional regulator [Virgisporangium aliadipatigenens]
MVERDRNAALAGTAVSDGRPVDGRVSADGLASGPNGPALDTATQYQAPDSVLARVRARLPEFTGALQRVAEHVLSDPAAAARATIVELAEGSGTSPATITRFCRAMDFEGYSELRLAIAAETGRAARAAGWTYDIGREIQPTDPLPRVLGQIMAADTQAMNDTAALLDLSEVERAADAIAGSSRVDIYGISGSALVGGELQFSLHRIGVAAWSWIDVHNGLASAALLRKGDVALGISHSGQTRETIELLAEAGSHGATTVALTSFPRSPIAEVADIILQTASQATTFRPDALSARHPQLVVLDLLYIAVAQRTHDRAHAAFQRTAQAVAGHKAAREARQQ